MSKDNWNFRNELYRFIGALFIFALIGLMSIVAIIVGIIYLIKYLIS